MPGVVIENPDAAAAAAIADSQPEPMAAMQPKAKRPVAGKPDAMHSNIGVQTEPSRPAVRPADVQTGEGPPEPKRMAVEPEAGPSAAGPSAAGPSAAAMKPKPAKPAAVQPETPGLKPPNDDIWSVIDTPELLDKFIVSFFFVKALTHPEPHPLSHCVHKQQVHSMYHTTNVISSLQVCACMCVCVVLNA